MSCFLPFLLCFRYSADTVKLPEFKKSVGEYLNKFDESIFLPSAEYDLEIGLSEINTSFARALEKIEPIGNSNVRPVFKTTVGKLDVSPCKSNPNHTNIIAETGLQIMAFNFYNENQFLMGANEKEILIEIQLSSYSGKENCKSVLRGVSPSELFVNPSVAQAAYLKYLAYPFSENIRCAEYKKADLARIADCGVFGTMLICGCEKSYRELDTGIKDKFVLNEFMYSTNKNNYSRICISPIFDSDILLSNYNKIIFVDAPPSKGVISFINSKSEAEVFVPAESNEKEIFAGLDVSRETFGRYFDILRRNSDISAQNIFSFFRVLASRVDNINVAQFVFCVTVFNELKFLKIKRDVFGIEINHGVKAELKNSYAYSRVAEVLL